MSNDIQSIQKNVVESEPSFENTPLTPVVKPSHSALNQFQSTPKTVNKALTRPFCKTPSARGKKRSQDTPLGNSVTYISPCNKSRLDYTSVPEMNIDIEAYKSEIVRLQQEYKSLIFAEKQLMTHEWTKAKRRARCELEFNTRQHESFTVNSQSQFKKMMQNSEKVKKTEERSIQKQEFLALVDAKHKLKLEEKLKDKDRLNIERQKSLGVRKAKEDTKEKLRKERNDKRKAFVESVEAAKAAELCEDLRVKREKEFELASDLLGQCKLLQSHCAQQRVALENTENLIFN